MFEKFGSFKGTVGGVVGGGEGCYGTSCILYLLYVLVVIVTTRFPDFMMVLKQRGSTKTQLEMIQCKHHVMW